MTKTENQKTTKPQTCFVGSLTALTLLRAF